MPTKHKVVALISGGKDSLFSLLHCLANEHEVVALANLHPEQDQASPSPTIVRPADAPRSMCLPSSSSSPSSDEDDDDDPNSHMYQTVLHQLLPLYATCLSLPLYRHPITGTALHTSKSYAHTSDGDDETEALLPLLELVKHHHPDITALSAGAILSSYQRTRIESVTLRLGLTPLAYLWRLPCLPPHTPTALLRDMADVGLEARVVKVASGGLDERHLWVDIASEEGMRGVGEAVGRFEGSAGVGEDAAVLGEGGEFETMALDGPWPVWRRRIVVAEGGWKVERRKGGTAAVKVLRAGTEEKESGGGLSVRVPGLFDEEFEEVLRCLKGGRAEGALGRTVDVAGEAGAGRWSCKRFECVLAETQDSLYVSNMTSAKPDAKQDAPTQLKDILANLTSILQDHSLVPAQVTLVTLLLRRMSDFPAINSTYATFFPSPNPPARITIAPGDLLPHGVNMVLSAQASKEPLDHRQGLHVQSQSYWAPANIGPYSQAISSPLHPPLDSLQNGDEDERVDARRPRLVHMAGQIPLIPVSMSLLPASFLEQTVLALQHLWRVGRAMGVRWWVGGGVAYFTADDNEHARDRAGTIIDAWKKAHELCGGEKKGRGVGLGEEDDDEVDIAELQLRARPWAAASGAVGRRGRKTRRRALPDWSHVEIEGGGGGEGGLGGGPPVVALQVAELPRSAPVEWTSLGVAAGGGGSDWKVVSSADRQPEAGCAPCCSTEESISGVRFCFFAIRQEADLGILWRRLDRQRDSGYRVELMEAFVSVPTMPSAYMAVLVDEFRAVVIPCYSVWANGIYAGTASRSAVVAYIRCRLKM